MAAHVSCGGVASVAFAGLEVPTLLGAGAAACQGAALHLVQSPSLTLSAPAEGCSVRNPPARAWNRYGVRVGSPAELPCFKRAFQVTL